MAIVRFESIDDGDLVEIDFATSRGTDVESLSLPAGVQGMVGLTFLRQFKSWGAERGERETWRFFLANEDESE